MLILPGTWSQNFFVIFDFIYYFFYFLTLQYCIGFAIYQNESATGIFQHHVGVTKLLVTASK